MFLRAEHEARIARPRCKCYIRVTRIICNSNKVLFHGMRRNLRACSVYESFAASQHHLRYIIKGRVSRSSSGQAVHVGNVLEIDTKKEFSNAIPQARHMTRNVAESKFD